MTLWLARVVAAFLNVLPICGGDLLDHASACGPVVATAPPRDLYRMPAGTMVLGVIDSGAVVYQCEVALVICGRMYCVAGERGAK